MTISVEAFFDGLSKAQLAEMLKEFPASLMDHGGPLEDDEYWYFYQLDYSGGRIIKGRARRKRRETKDGG